jgi:hypothetical protein
MSTLREDAKELLDKVPEDNLPAAIDALEQLASDPLSEGWPVWSEMGDEAVEGTWEDASERHDEYLYRGSRP